MKPTAYDLSDFLAGRDPDGRLRRAMADMGSELRRAAEALAGREPISLLTPGAVLGFLEWSSAHVETKVGLSSAADEPVATGPATIAAWLNRLRSDDPAARGEALQHLVNQQLEMLSLIAGSRPAEPLPSDPIESAARSALRSMYQGVREGRYPSFADPKDLWGLLIWVAHRKLRQRALESGSDPDFDPRVLAETLGALLRRLFAKLRPEQAEIARRCLANQPTESIAAELRLMPESVDESLQLIALQIGILEDAA